MVFDLDNQIVQQKSLPPQPFSSNSGRTPLSTISRRSVSITACRSLLTSQLLSIRLLLSLEDTERSHQACLRYLKSSYFMYYPEMNILADEARSLARQLGGDLAPPQLSWKYSLIRNLLGWKMAKASMRWAPLIKVAVLRTYDKALYGIVWPGNQLQYWVWIR